MGKFSQKILKRGAFVCKYFDQNFTFLSKEVDPITGFFFKYLYLLINLKNIISLDYMKPLLLGEKATRDVGLMLKNESRFKVEE